MEKKHTNYIMISNCKAPLTWCNLQANGFFGYDDASSQKLHVAGVIASAVFKGHMRKVEVSITALSHTLTLLNVPKPCSKTARNRTVVYTFSLVLTDTHANSLLSIQ